MDTKCPQRGNRSAGNVIEYMRLMLAGNSLEQIGAQYGVTHGAVRKALAEKLQRKRAKLAAPRAG